MRLEEKIKFALENTEIIKSPKKFLSTYESTTVNYYLLTVPFYLEFEGKSADSETMVRQGRITWKKPRLITPGYILKMEGFSDEAKKAFHILAGNYGNLAMMLYRLRFIKDFDHMEIVSTPLAEVARKVDQEIEKKQDPFCGIIRGVDEFWDVSLSKFIYELAVNSAYFSQMPEFAEDNLVSLGISGFPTLVRDDTGIPLAAKLEIEGLFDSYRKGEIESSRLKDELDRWGLFDHYQDKFFSLFRKRR